MCRVFVSGGTPLTHSLLVGLRDKGGFFPTLPSPIHAFPEVARKARETVDLPPIATRSEVQPDGT